MHSSKFNYSCWQDIQSNQLYKINKQNGSISPIKKDLTLKSMYSNQLTGKATYLDRINFLKQQHLPKLPKYFLKQNKSNLKYQTQVTDQSPLRLKQNTQIKIKKKKLQLNPNLNYSLVQQVNSKIKQNREECKKKFLQKTENNLPSLKKENLNPLNLLQLPDDSDFFKLTRYNTNNVQNKIKIYKYNNNPQNQNYLKPLPLQNYSIINKDYFQKKNLIQKLEKCCIERTQGEKKKKNRNLRKGNYSLIIERRFKDDEDRELRGKQRKKIEQQELKMIKKYGKDIKERLIVKKMQQKRQKKLIENLFLQMENKVAKLNFKEYIKKSQGN